MAGVLDYWQRKWLLTAGGSTTMDPIWLAQKKRNEKNTKWTTESERKHWTARLVSVVPGPLESELLRSQSEALIAIGVGYSLCYGGYVQYLRMFDFYPYHPVWWMDGLKETHSNNPPGGKFSARTELTMKALVVTTDQTHEPHTDTALIKARSATSGIEQAIHV